MQEDGDCLLLLGDKDIMHNKAACFLLIKHAGPGQLEGESEVEVKRKTDYVGFFVLMFV